MPLRLTYGPLFARLLLVVTFALGSENVRGQENSSLSVLSLNDCISIALQNQPAIQAQRSKAGAAQQQQQIARSYFLPQVGFEARYTNLDEPLSVDFPNPVTGTLADAAGDGAAFFGIARAAGTNAAVAALDNPGISVAPGLPSFNQARSVALSQLPDTFRVGLLGENSVTTELLLTQPIWTGGKITNRYEQAKTGVQVASADISKSQQQTAFEASQAYFGVQLAYGLEEPVIDAVGHFRAMERLIMALIDEGDEYVSTVDLYRIRTALNLARAQHIETQALRDTAKAALQRAMGLDGEFAFDIAQPHLVRQTYEAQLPVLLAEAFAHRPELSQARSAARIAELERRIAKAGYKPDVALFGRFSTIHDDRSFQNPNEQQQEQWAAGVSVGMPLFTGGRRTATVRQAEYQFSQARQAERALQQYIQLEVQKTYLDYRQAEEQLGPARQACEDAEQLLEGYRNQFLGDQIEEQDMPRFFKDQLEARILLTRARTRYAEALYNHALARARIRLVTGSQEFFHEDENPHVGVVTLGDLGD